MPIGSAIAGGAAAAGVGALLGGNNSGGGGGGGFRNNNQFLGNTGGLFDLEFNTHGGGRADATARATGQLGSLQREGISDARLFGGMARNNQGADLAGQLGLDFLGGLEAFDPAQIAQMQFDQLFPILQGGFEDDRLALENRQFSQGRLGSVPGSNDFNALLDSQEDAKRRLLFDSFGQGLAAQSQQANLGSGLLQLDPQLRGLFQNLGTSSLNNSLAIQNAANQTFSTFAGAQGGGGGGQILPSTLNQIGAGLINSGVAGITGGVSGLFNPSSNAGTTNWLTAGGGGSNFNLGAPQTPGFNLGGG